MTAGDQRGIWFIDTLEAGDRSGEETTSLCFNFEVQEGRSDLKALHQALPSIVPRVPLLEDLLVMARESGFDSNADWMEMQRFLKLFRRAVISAGFILIWDKRLY